MYYTIVECSIGLRCMVIDFCKAFDCVLHQLLLSKLKKACSISGNALK